MTGDPVGAQAHLAETCTPPEPLWKVVRALVAAALARAGGADEQAATRLDVACGAAELAGPWTAEWVRQQRSAPRPVGAEPAEVLPGSPWMTGSDGQVVEQLTPREVEVLTAMSEWLTTEEIAEKLFVSVNTVRTHVRNILTKLGVSRRNAAIREALRLGLFVPDARLPWRRAGWGEADGGPRPPGLVSVMSAYRSRHPRWPPLRLKREDEEATASGIYGIIVSAAVMASSHAETARTLITGSR